MKRGWLLVLLVSLGLNLGLGYRLWQSGRQEPPAPHPLAHHGPQPGPGEPDGPDAERWGDFARLRLQRMAERLDLRPDQVDRLAEAQEARGGLLHERRMKVEEARRSLHAMMQADPVDEAAVRAVIADLGRRQAAMDSLAAEAMLQELKILDPGQRERYLRLLPLQGGRSPGGIGRRGAREGRFEEPRQ